MVAFLRFRLGLEFLGRQLSVGIQFDLITGPYFRGVANPNSTRQKIQLCCKTTSPWKAQTQINRDHCKGIALTSLLFFRHSLFSSPLLRRNLVWSYRFMSRCDVLPIIRSVASLSMQVATFHISNLSPPLHTSHHITFRFA